MRFSSDTLLLQTHTWVADYRVHRGKLLACKTEKSLRLGNNTALILILWFLQGTFAPDPKRSRKIWHVLCKRQAWLDKGQVREFEIL